jgi:putative hemolysin
MIWLAILLFVLGIAMSAIFSGSETGFYRASRIRLVLDALEGDPISRALVVLVNYPSLFLATSLVGTNLAHYTISLSTVLGMEAILVESGHWGELIASLVLTPVVFVYGDLVPKNLFLHAPNRLLRVIGPVYLLFVVLFLPVAGVLWAVDRLLSRLGRTTPQRVRLVIARRELRRVMEEGHEEGILHPAQQELAQGIFTLAKEPVAKYLIPLAVVSRARSDMSKDDVLRLARRLQLVAVPVEEASSQRRLLGYLRVAELKIHPGEDLSPMRPLVEIPQTDTYINALTKLHAARESMAVVVDAQGKTLGLLTAQRLRQPLFGAGT